MNALEKLQERTKKGLHICVGLDTDINKIPGFLKAEKDPVYEFNKIIIENTADAAAAYKLNLAFYEKDGARGLDSVMRTLELFPKNVLIIGDAKRGDIGNTSQMYAASIYDHFNFDSTTLHPYMGFDSLSPFLEYKDKLNFILALTSNKGSADFEKQKLDDGTYLFQRVIIKASEWNEKKNCGIVFGATHPGELRDNIDLIGDLAVLLPGVGAQGGSLTDVAQTFHKAKRAHYLVNVSRALIYADDSREFGSAAAEVLKGYNAEIKQIINT